MGGGSRVPARRASRQWMRTSRHRERHARRGCAAAALGGGAASDARQARAHPGLNPGPPRAPGIEPGTPPGRRGTWVGLQPGYGHFCLGKGYAQRLVCRSFLVKGEHAALFVQCSPSGWLPVASNTTPKVAMPSLHQLRAGCVAVCGVVVCLGTEVARARVEAPGDELVAWGAHPRHGDRLGTLALTAGTKVPLVRENAPGVGGR